MSAEDEFHGTVVGAEYLSVNLRVLYAGTQPL